MKENESLLGKNLIFNQFDFAIFGILLQVWDINLRKSDERRNLISLYGKRKLFEKANKFYLILVQIIN